MSARNRCRPLPPAVHELQDQELSTHLTEISRQRRRGQKAAAARRQADEDFDRCYQLIGRSTAADYHMAGLEAEAERVRPPRRRGGREVEDEEPVDETGDDSETEPDARTGDVEPTIRTPEGRRPASPLPTTRRSRSWESPCPPLLKGGTEI
jgi:hypothetical protein